jgi:hypothetical protein
LLIVTLSRDPDASILTKKPIAAFDMYVPFNGFLLHPMRGGPLKSCPMKAKGIMRRSNKQKVTFKYHNHISYSEVVETNCELNKYWLDFIDLLHLAILSLYEKMLQIDTQYCA